MNDGSIVAERIGGLVLVSITCSIGETNSFWERLTLAAGLPKPAASEASSLVVCQTCASPFLIQITGSGLLQIRGTGSTEYPGGWTFGSLAYLSA